MIHAIGAVALAGAGVLGFVAGYRWDTARKRDVQSVRVRNLPATA